VLQTNERGRVIYRNTVKSMFLNEVIPVVRPAPHARRDPVANSLPSAPPAPGSWAAAVQHGIKRLPVVNTLNHQPKKRQSDGGAAVYAPQPPLSNPKTNSKSSYQQGQPNLKPQPTQEQHPVVQPPHPAVEMNAHLNALDARLAALEHRLSKMDMTTTTERLLHNVEMLTARLEQHVQQSNAIFAILNQRFTLWSAGNALQPELNSEASPSPSPSPSVRPPLPSLPLQPVSSAMTCTQPEPAAAPRDHSLTTEHSASAHPARDNGSAARHG
jgi:hypothetical protein